jgi:hypothetical protein
MDFDAPKNVFSTEISNFTENKIISPELLRNLFYTLGIRRECSLHIIQMNCQI